MQYVFKLMVFSIIFSTLFLSNCTSPSSSKEKLQDVSFSNVWVSNDADLVDLDGDGYYSNLRLNIDLDVSSGSLEAFLLVGVRVYDPVDTATYYEYVYTSNFLIEGSSSEDAVYLVLGLDTPQLQQASYDFIIQAFSTANPEGVVAEASATTYQALANIPMEENKTDVGLSIYSVDWDLNNLVDQDGDEYFTEAALIVDVDVNSGSTDVYLAIYAKLSGTSSYTLQALTEDFSIFEDDWEDAVVLEPFVDFQHGIYDFKVEAFFSENLYVEDEYEIENMALETSSEDTPAYLWLWHTDETFEDGLTYTSGILLAQIESHKITTPHKNPQKVKSRIVEKDAVKSMQESVLPAKGIEYNSAVKKVKVEKIKNNKSGTNKKRPSFGSALTSGPAIELSNKYEEPTISREELRKKLNTAKIVRKK